MGIGSHQSANAKTVEWLTPPHILSALGEFDLDPCASINRPWDTAKKHYTVEDNGLNHQWSGRVWCNPPYGKDAAIWLARMADHKNGIALIFARTETDMFFEHVWNGASGLFFIKGRLRFHYPNGTKASGSGGPSVLVAYGDNDYRVLAHQSEIPGKMVRL